MPVSALTIPLIPSSINVYLTAACDASAPLKSKNMGIKKGSNIVSRTENVPEVRNHFHPTPPTPRKQLTTSSQPSPANTPPPDHPPALSIPIIGLKRAAANPNAKGKVHAWVGIICGAIFGLVRILLDILFLIGIADRASSHP